MHLMISVSLITADALFIEQLKFYQNCVLDVSQQYARAYQLTGLCLPGIKKPPHY
jgi:hypothetical protein